MNWVWARYVLIILLISIVSVGTLEAKNAFDRAQFESRVMRYLNPVPVEVGGRDPVPREVYEKSNQYQYAFVAGFLNGGNSDYFADHQQVLSELGVDDDHMQFIYPPSDSSAEDNSEYVGDELEKSAGQKLVIFAHSKGGLETLIWAIRHADFVTSHVRKIILDQPVLRGSRIADFLQNQGRPLPSKLSASEWNNFIHQKVSSIPQGMPPRAWDVFDVMWEVESWFNQFIDEGVKTLTSQAASSLWDQLLKDYEKDLSRISDKIVYLRGAEYPAKMREEIYSLGWYILTAYQQPSDGLLTLDDQYLPQLGSILTDLNVDHMDLAASKGNGHGTLALRRAVMQSLVETVVETEGKDG